MTNGEKFKEVFKISQVDEGELYAYVWLPNHDAAEISIEWWNAEYEEPVIRDNGIKDELNRVKDELEPTTKNDLAHNLCDSCINYRCEFQSGIVRTKCAFYMPSVTPQELRWIPVSERLPEKDMACLVAVGRFNFTQIAVYSDLMGIIDHRIFYQGDVGHNSFKNITQYVKAWMPLPKPYREVEE